MSTKMKWLGNALFYLLLCSAHAFSTPDTVRRSKSSTILKPASKANGSQAITLHFTLNHSEDLVAAAVTELEKISDPTSLDFWETLECG